MTADNNHADSADGSWEEGSDHIPIAPSTGKAAIRSPLAMLQAATMLESLPGVCQESWRRHFALLAVLILSLTILPAVSLLKSSALSQEMLH